MEKKNDQGLLSSSSSSLPSHDDVCEFMFAEHKGTNLYPLFAKFYATMVDQIPDSGMDEIKKAVKDGEKEEALNIMHRLYEGQESADLHRINAEIYTQIAADSFEYLNKGIASATTSVQLSPHDIENHFVLVSLLSMAAPARGVQGRQLVIQKCKEALDIDQSKDKDDPRAPTSTRSKMMNLLRVREGEMQEFMDSVWKPMNNNHYILVDIPDLGTFLKDELEKNFVKEAWEFGISHPSWKFWMCFCSEEKFDRSEVLFKHFADRHLTQRAKSIICTGTLEHENPSSSLETVPIQENPSSSLERVPIQERISAHAASSQLIVAASCLLNLGTDTSQTAFPSRDLSITARSYRPKLIEWTDLIDSRRRQGAQLHRALDKKSQMKEAESAGTEMGAIEKALERLSTDIDSKIKKNGEWILRTGEETDDLRITENPFGEYDYRSALLPLVQSYIWACVEKRADKSSSGEI